MSFSSPRLPLHLTPLWFSGFARTNLFSIVVFSIIPVKFESFLRPFLVHHCDNTDVVKNDLNWVKFDITNLTVYMSLLLTVPFALSIIQLLWSSLSLSFFFARNGGFLGKLCKCNVTSMLRKPLGILKHSTLLYSSKWKIVLTGIKVFCFFRRSSWNYSLSKSKFFSLHFLLFGQSLAKGKVVEKVQRFYLPFVSLLYNTKK